MFACFVHYNIPDYENEIKLTKVSKKRTQKTTTHLTSYLSGQENYRNCFSSCMSLIMEKARKMQYGFSKFQLILHPKSLGRQDKWNFLALIIMYCESNMVEQILVLVRIIPSHKVISADIVIVHDHLQMTGLSLVHTQIKLFQPTGM